MDGVDALATVVFWSSATLAPGPAERVAFPAECSFQLAGLSFDVLEKTSGLKRRSETIWFSSELAAAGIFLLGRNFGAKLALSLSNFCRPIFVAAECPFMRESLFHRDIILCFFFMSCRIFSASAELLNDDEELVSFKTVECEELAARKLPQPTSPSLKSAGLIGGFLLLNRALWAGFSREFLHTWLIFCVGVNIRDSISFQFLP